MVGRPEGLIRGKEGRCQKVFKIGNGGQFQMSYF